MTIEVIDIKIIAEMIAETDGYESDRAALQLRTTEAEIHDNFDAARVTEEADYLTL